MMKRVSRTKSEPRSEREPYECPVGVTHVPALQFREYQTEPSRSGCMPSGTPNDLLTSLAVRPSRRDGAREHDAEATYLLSVVSAWSYAGPEQLLGMLKRLFPDRVFSCKYIHGYNDALLVNANVYILNVDVEELVKNSGEKSMLQTRRFHIVCFAGTDWKNFTDWFIDVGASPRQFLSLGMVHDGFYRNVESIAQPLRELLCTDLKSLSAATPCDSSSSVSNEDASPVYVCGHSLGAAMALLASAMLWFDRDAALRRSFRRGLRGVYLYGAPAVGDATFAESCKGDFSDLVFQHVYKNDIAYSMPPRTAGKFVHVGKQYVSGDQGWVRSLEVAHTTRFGVISNLIGFSAFVVNTFWFTRWLGRYLPFSWVAHKPANYVLTSRVQECQKLFG